MFAGLIEYMINGVIWELCYLKKIPLLIFSLSLINTAILKAQDSTSTAFHPIDGLSIESGLRYLIVKDEYISQERYSASTSFVSLDWSKYHETYNFHLYIDILNNARINNYNVTAKVTEFDLSLSYLYPIGTLNIFNRGAHFYLGPVPELFYHSRHQDIPVTVNSKTVLISGGIRIDLLYPLNNRLYIESQMQSSIISLDQGESTDAGSGITSSQSEIVTLLSGLRYTFSAGIRFLLMSPL